MHFILEKICFEPFARFAAYPGVLVCTRYTISISSPAFIRIHIKNVLHITSQRVHDKETNSFDLLMNLIFFFSSINGPYSAAKIGYGLYTSASVSAFFTCDPTCGDITTCWELRQDRFACAAEPDNKAIARATATARLGRVTTSRARKKASIKKKGGTRGL